MNRLSNPEQDVADAISHGKSFFPYPDDVFVHSMFPQMWGDSSMGFSGVGGQAITTEYTIILTDHQMFAVYFGGRFAYSVVSPTKLFFQDIQNRSVAP